MRILISWSEYTPTPTHMLQWGETHCSRAAYLYAKLSASLILKKMIHLFPPLGVVKDEMARLQIHTQPWLGETFFRSLCGQSRKKNTIQSTIVGGPQTNKPLPNNNKTHFNRFVLQNWMTRSSTSPKKKGASSPPLSKNVMTHGATKPLSVGI